MITEDRHLSSLEVDKEEYSDNPNEKSIDDYKTKRTIEEVLDNETGEIIKSIDFFKKPEH